MHTIPNRHSPIVGAFRELVDTPDPTGRRLLLDGVHLVTDAHRSGLEFELVVVASSHLDAASEAGTTALMLGEADVEIYSASDAVMSAISPVRTSSGIVGIARRDASTPLSLSSAPDAFILIAVDVQDPGNLGSLVRAAEAAGVSGLIVAGTSANPFGWKALRGSMGSALRLPIATGAGLDDVLANLKSSGTRLVAAAPRDGVDPEEMDWRGSIALLLGGEGPGLDARVIAACDSAVTIPMAASVDSLNVAVAGALLAYAARRQRT